ncbi:SPOCS domain-containing protein [Caldicellulosiruptoraceae bacterium PP1]
MNKEFDKIEYLNVFGSDSQKVIIEGEIVLPEIKPNIQKVLQSDAEVIITKVQVLNDKVLVEGQVDFKLIYQSTDEQRKISWLSSSADFSKTFDILGVKPNMECEIKEGLVYSYCSPLSERKIQAKAIVDLNVSVKSTVSIEYLKDVKDDSIKYLKEEIKLSNPIVLQEKINKKESLELPSGKASIREILRSYAKLTDKNIKLDGRKVNIDLKVDVKTIYSPDIAALPIETVEHDVFVSYSFNLPEQYEDLSPIIKLSIEDFRVVPKTDDQGELRKIDCEIDICVNLLFNKIDKVVPIIDIYSVNKKLNEIKKTLNIDQYLGDIKENWTIKDIANLQDDIEEVFSATSRVEIDSVKTVRDAIEVKGVIIVFVIYLSKDMLNPLKSSTIQIPFTHRFDFNGIFEEDKVYANIDVENISFSILSHNEIELRCHLNADILANRTRYVEIIVDVDFGEEILDEDVRLAPIYIYTVQKGDSLWKIAKKYRTTVEKIVAFNQIEDENLIYPGQKLIIVK